MECTPVSLTGNLSTQTSSLQKQCHLSTNQEGGFSLSSASLSHPVLTLSKDGRANTTFMKSGCLLSCCMTLSTLLVQSSSYLSIICPFSPFCGYDQPQSLQPTHIISHFLPPSYLLGRNSITLKTDTAHSSKIRVPNCNPIVSKSTSLLHYLRTVQSGR